MNTNCKEIAYCMIEGSDAYPNIHGMVRFYSHEDGIMMDVNVAGLPMPRNMRCKQPIFGFHIHEGNACSGTRDMPFENALGHYNPNRCMHPYHAGDLPPLFANRDGMARMTFLNDRFRISDVIGRAMIIHASPDDFHTQPSGNSGTMMACGIIKRVQTNAY